MKTKNLGILALLALLAIGVLISGCSSTSDHDNTPTPSPKPETWEMKEVWNMSTVGIPFMDLRPDGQLGAVIDFDGNTLYLVKPDGEHKKFNVQGNDWGAPVIVNVFIIGDSVYVPATYAEFEGARVYTWDGFSGEIKFKEGIIPDVADTGARSPNGDYACYLVTGDLYCQDFKHDSQWKFDTGNIDYSMLSVSDDGYVIVGPGDPILVLKDGKLVSSLNTDSHMALAYKDRIITQINNSLVILNPEGEILASNKEFGFHINPLDKITPVVSEKYIFAFKAFEKVHALDWNLKEIRTLPGYPEFANNNFVVTSKDGVLHCYSLKDFHEVWTVKPPDSIGYVKISNDGKVLLVSGDAGDFYLYKG